MQACTAVAPSRRNGKKANERVRCIKQRRWLYEHTKHAHIDGLVVRQQNIPLECLCPYLRDRSAAEDMKANRAARALRPHSVLQWPTNVKYNADQTSLVIPLRLLCGATEHTATGHLVQ